MDLSQLPRDIEKIILDEILADHYFKQHQKKFKKVLKDIKSIMAWRSPRYYDDEPFIKIHYIRTFYTHNGCRDVQNALSSYDNYYCIFDKYGELIVIT